MPAPPVPASSPDPSDDRIGESFATGGDVGSFRQGSPFSQWALARYLVGRAVTESLGRSLLVLGVLALVVAAGVWLGLHSAALGIVLLLVGAAVLVFRALLLGIVHRLTGVRSSASLEQRMQALVDDTRPDVLRELRRIGLPGRTWTLPLLVVRFAGRERRSGTVERLRRFEIERVVPPARLDELHLLLQTELGASGAPWSPA